MTRTEKQYRRLLAAGLTVRQIAKRRRVTMGAVYVYLRKNGLRINRVSDELFVRDADRLDRIETLGWRLKRTPTSSEIARLLGWPSGGHVSAWAQRVGGYRAMIRLCNLEPREPGGHV